MPHVRIAWRFEIMRAVAGNRELARRIGIQMPRTLLAGEALFLDFFLQGHEGVEQRLRAWGATGNVNINGDVAIDAFKHIIALLEGTAGDCAGAHRDNVFRFRHLVVEPDDLRRHFLGDGAGDNHEIGLARRRSEDLGAKSRKVVTGHAGGNHLDGTTSEAELEGPYGVFSTPIVEFFELESENALFAQLVFECLINHNALSFPG